MERGKILEPIRVGGTYYSPTHFSPIFAVICLASLALTHIYTPFISLRADIPAAAEWGFLLFNFVVFSFGAGFLPPFLVSIEKHSGYPSVYCSLLVLSFIPLLGLWINPNVDISPISAFFQTAGAIGVVLLFVWPFIEHIGTHDSGREAHDEWIMHNAVASLLRRGEIVREEARIANPFELDKPDIQTRLRGLPPFTRQSIEREMIIESMVQANKRKFDFRR